MCNIQHRFPFTLIQPGKGRFTLAYMSHDYLHGLHAGLPGWIRVKRLGPSNTTHWQHSFSDLAILTPREFCLYEYMKKCYWDLAVLFETGLPESLCQILPESLKLDPAGFSFKMQTFFDFFLAFFVQNLYSRLQ